LGDTPTVIDEYLNDAWQSSGGGEARDLSYFRRDKSGDPTVRITRLKILGGHGDDPLILRTAEDFTIHCEITSCRAYPKAYVAFWLTNQNGERVATFLNADAGDQLALRQGVQIVECRVNALPLTPGRYVLTIGVNEGVQSTALDLLVDVPAFQVVMPEVENGILDWPHRPWGCFHWNNVNWSIRPDAT
jgi:hypothetical protein